QLAFQPRFYTLLDIGIGQHQLVWQRRHADLFCQFLLQGDSRLHSLESILQCCDHLVFTDFFGASFHHSNGVSGTSNHQVQRTGSQFVCRQECLRLAIYQADAETRNGTVEGCAGQHECCAHGNHGDDVGTESRIHAEHGCHALHFVPVALWPQRTDRTVDEAADQYCLVGGLAFTLDEAAAADLAGGIKPFFVVDAEREIIQPTHLVFAHHGSTEENGVAVGSND